MTTLEKKLRAGLRRLGIEKRDTHSRLLVAVSGGADSMALLDALVRWWRGHNVPTVAEMICVAHFNHLLRGEESDADEEFVRETAQRLGLTAIIERDDVAAHAKAERQNLEAAARTLRYAFFERAAQRFAARYVATAHTFDDQVETILLRLLRGSSAAGLRGIHYATSLASGATLIRPLLAVSRDEVLAHCAHSGLAFRTDSSNESRDFTRNRVRHELLPLLKSFNPRVGEALVRAAALAAEDDEYLSARAAELVDVHGKGRSLELRAFAKLHPALRRRVLREWLRAARGHLRRIEAAHLLAVDALAVRGEGGGRVELPGGAQVRRAHGWLCLIHPESSPDPYSSNVRPEDAPQSSNF